MSSSFKKLFRFHPFTASMKGTILSVPTSFCPHGSIKKEISPTLYGKKCDNIIIDSHCGKYNFMEYRNASSLKDNNLLMKELKSALRRDSSNSLPTRIPGRILSSVLEKNGRKSYYVGVGGMIALLPSTNIPSMHHFSPRDISNRKAYWFYLLKVQPPSTLILSLLPPQQQQQQQQQQA